MAFVDLGDLYDLADDIERAGDGGAKAAHEAVKTVGAAVHRQAQAAAPQDRPWLSTQGIRRKTWKDRRGSHTDVFTVPDEEGRPVGMFVEYGTADTPPQAFLTIQAPYAEQALPEAVRANLKVLE